MIIPGKEGKVKELSIRLSDSMDSLMEALSAYNKVIEEQKKCLTPATRNFLDMGTLGLAMVNGDEPIFISTRKARTKKGTE